MLFQIDQSLDDVGKPRDCPPVPFSREVQNPRRDDTRKEIGLPESHLAGLAAPDVVLVHIGKTLLELQRDPFAHHADTVDRVDERLGARFKQVALQGSEHDFFPQRKKR